MKTICTIKLMNPVQTSKCLQNCSIMKIWPATKETRTTTDEITEFVSIKQKNTLGIMHVETIQLSDSLNVVSIE